MTRGPRAPGRLTWRRVLGGAGKPIAGGMGLAAPIGFASVLPAPAGYELEAGAAATQEVGGGMMDLTTPLLVVLLAVIVISVIRRVSVGAR